MDYTNRLPVTGGVVAIGSVVLGTYELLAIALMLLILGAGFIRLGFRPGKTIAER